MAGSCARYLPALLEGVFSPSQNKHLLTVNSALPLSLLSQYFFFFEIFFFDVDHF